MTTAMVLHRVRSRLVNARETLINQLRAILLERGHRIALVAEMRANGSNSTNHLALNREFMDLVRAQEQARRLMTVPGVGVLNATALIAAVGECRSSCFSLFYSTNASSAARPTGCSRSLSDHPTSRSVVANFCIRL